VRPEEDTYDFPVSRRLRKLPQSGRRRSPLRRRQAVRPGSGDGPSPEAQKAERAAENLRRLGLLD